MFLNFLIWRVSPDEGYSVCAPIYRQYSPVDGRPASRTCQGGVWLRFQHPRRACRREWRPTSRDDKTYARHGGVDNQYLREPAIG